MSSSSKSSKSSKSSTDTSSDDSWINEEPLSINQIKDSLDRIKDIHELLNKVVEIKNCLINKDKDKYSLFIRQAEEYAIILTNYENKYYSIKSGDDFYEVNTNFLENLFTYNTIKEFIDYIDKTILNDKT